jgi:hypothetical protein
MARLRVAHVMKLTLRTGVVGFASFAFDGPLPLADTSTRLYAAVIAALDANTTTRGKYQPHRTSGRTDWFLQFPVGVSELTFDQIMRAAATSCTIPIYIENSIPLAEQTSDSDGFRFNVNPTRRRPSN